MREKTKQIAAWFLGPKAENASVEEEMVLHILRDYYHWRRNYYPADEITITQQMRRESSGFSDALLQQLSEMLAGLKRHYPFYSPRYIAHMISDQTTPARLGYFAAMLYNPNNVTTEAAPVTVEWELEVAAQILRMLGYQPPPQPGAHHRETRREFGWAHVAGSGTIANLEALWVARDVRYFPLAVQQASVRHGIGIGVKLPGDPPQTVRPIGSVDAAQLLSIKPNEAIFLLPRWVDAVRRHENLSEAEAAGRAWQLIRDSGLYIPSSGTAACFGKYPPAILVSGTAHYSIGKAADILGIGRSQVIQVETCDRFRLDPRDLEAKEERARREGLFPLAVVAIAGTTEEGAVDPVHRIAEWRTRLELESHRSLWLHIDAAWGGYLRTLFVDANGAETSCESVGEFVSRPLDLSRKGYHRTIGMRWGSPEVIKAFCAFAQAESITVDPHKMGYIPYPCGVAAFRNDRVRHFLSQEAPYLAEWAPDDVQFRPYEPPANIGPFVLEGSKPGAAAAACWLSHRMIPPNRDGYGEVMRASLLAARELHERLIHWEASCRANQEPAAYRFLTVTECPPDTNIVCFLVQEKGNRSLARMNALGQAIYQEFTLPPGRQGERPFSYNQPFFLSRTRFEPPHYSPRSVAGLLARAEVDPGGYEAEGIFVLRATVMSPYIVLMEETGHRQSFLAEFLETLAGQASRLAQVVGDAGEAREC